MSVTINVVAFTKNFFIFSIAQMGAAEKSRLELKPFAIKIELSQRNNCKKKINGKPPV